jgi:hypothetical protein
MDNEKINWYKDDKHRILRLQQMRAYYYKKKQELLKDFEIVISKQKNTIHF